jgi:hypothetical protein
MMKNTVGLVLVCASSLAPFETDAASFADAVVSYNPGVGFATDFSSGEGFTNAAAALGAPSVVTPGPFGGPVDPFNPPYLKEQVVSIGAGGSLTLSFSSPIQNLSSHPFGLDFIVFGNAGFVITNGDFTGGGITDGSLFGANSGVTRVAVSADDSTYFTLDPARAPAVDTLFPMDGSGNFELPVDPALDGADFAGAGLEGIRALYGGAGGGTGFDLSWALDGTGQSVVVPEVRFIRIEVLSGAAEIDGVSAVAIVPEPGPGWLLALGLAGMVLAQIRVRREHPRVG